MKKLILLTIISFLLSACSSGGNKPSSTTSDESTESEETSESSETTTEELPTTYNLNLTINVNNIGNTFHDIQFVYNYTNGTGSSTYNWDNKISDVKQDKYEYKVKDLDINKTLYFRIYIWDSSLNDIYVGKSSTSNFTYTSSGKTEERIIIDFDYPTSAGNIAGTYHLDNTNPSTKMSHDDITTSIYKKNVIINPTFDHDKESFIATYEGDNIRIEDNKIIYGLKSNTVTEVTITSENGLTTKFNVTVSKSTYKATSARDGKWANDEKWFNSNEVSSISNLGKDFYNGFDISSVKALYDNGAKFFNKNNEEESLFYILKDNGINWIRLKLFVDPFTPNGISYGSGEASLDNVLWEAKEVKHAGLKFLLDFHYSDYWTHPGQQIVPKAWKDATSVEELCNYIKSYTKETLEIFKNNDCLPDMVQLGNEISSGSFLQYPGSDNGFNSEFEPGYTTNKSNLSNTLRGTAGSDNMVSYLNAASEGVNEVDSNIKKVIHWAKGSQISSNIINNFYNALSKVDYDYAGLSLYPYYCFPTGTSVEGGGNSELDSLLSGLNLSKPWFVAETSYPFSGSSWVYENDFAVTNFIVNDWSTNAQIANVETLRTNYPFTPAGQAKMIYDMTYSVNKYNGLGIFYWEGAWIPNAKVGWAGVGSPCSWSNQGFFSYDGKAIGNLDLFKQMNPNI